MVMVSGKPAVSGRLFSVRVYGAAHVRQLVKTTLCAPYCARYALRVKCRCKDYNY